ncbi:serine hydrolase domain-containing protein [Streptomyces sp. NPDC059175]|uniref:serine hydrolase domain-containing protein n=1 Tax=Streptomyces sp. NPDC059175 TaxID=3346757 RepID=UPI0036BE2692
MTRTPERRGSAQTAHRRITAALTTTGLLALTACTAPTTASAPPAEAATSATPSAAAPVRELTPAVTARLDKAIEGTRRQAGVPGVIVGLFVPGEAEYVRSFGVADKSSGAPMSDDLHMRIGSETKTFTVTALLRLVDAGKVGLDDPVSEYLQGVPGGNGISLRQLAEMRSGLFSYSEDPDFDKAFLADPDRDFTPEQLLGYAFKHPANFPPGQKFQYSNTNTILLGLVVEKVSGRSLGDFLQREVFRPSGLERTLFPVGAEFPKPHAQGYTTQTENGEQADATDWNPSWAWAAGAMISDLDDLRTWGRVVATGTLLKPATQAQRLRTLPTGYPGTGYGLGIFVNHGWLGHNGSLPGYQSVVVYLPSAKATLVVLSNTDNDYLGNENSTLFAKTITGIVTPGNIYDLPPAPPSSASPSG